MSMRSDVQDRLDRIDSFEPGRGNLDAFIFGSGDLSAGSLGFGLDYSHRITTNVSAFANASAGYYYGEERSGLGYDFFAGIRGTF